MNTSHIPFPKTAKLFKCRSDMALELCFADYSTSRAIQRQIETAVYCGHDFPSLILDEYDPDLCESYRPARFYIYCGLGVKGVGCISPFVSDGKTWMPTFADGLYKEMLEQAARAHGSPDKVLVFPVRPHADVFKEWIYPANAVLHDTISGMAAVVPYKTAFEYLTKFN